MRPGGLVLTCSCSGLVSEETFLSVVRDAALDVRREIRILAVAGAAPDHPVAGAFPEGSGPGRSEGSAPPGTERRPRGGGRAATDEPDDA